MDKEKVKFGVIREGKVPPDERVPLTPDQCRRVVAERPEVEWVVEHSPIRCFGDEQYTLEGIRVTHEMASEKADVLLGIKEVPIDQLIPGATYVFFSHTAKMQPYNKELLRSIVEKQITLIDWEYLQDASGQRLIGFGRYAGIAGAYNGLRALGLRHSLYALKPAHQCEDRAGVSRELKKVALPPFRILLTGRGRVARGAMEILDELRVRKVTMHEYLQSEFHEPVYCQVTFPDYFRPKEGGEFVLRDFYAHPERYESNFMRFARVSDMYIAGHYWDPRSPVIFSREDAKREDFRIRVVADISCDIDGPVASTLRASTIADPFYGYDPHTERETDFMDPGAITVMAVDNLPCELPGDASRDFGEAFIRSVLPSFLNRDKYRILKRATIVKKGVVTEPFAYLRDWLEN